MDGLLARSPALSASSLRCGSREREHHGKLSCTGPSLTFEWSKSPSKRRSGTRRLDPIRIGLVADEPIRLAGLASIFDQPAKPNHAQLLPVIGSISELLARSSSQLPGRRSALFASRAQDPRRHPPRLARTSARSSSVPQETTNWSSTSIIAGARAYLDLNAGPEMVRKAIEVVTEGSIWAPRRLALKTH